MAMRAARRARADVASATRARSSGDDLDDFGDNLVELSLGEPSILANDDARAERHLTS